MNRRGWIVGAVVLLVAGLCGGSSLALTDEEIFRDFRFNFISPGARALGLGGAFIAAADDATAAEANPAALHYINKVELFAEYRARTPVSNPIFPSVDTENIGTFTTLDFSTINNLEDDQQVTFASIALPFNIGRRRATLAFSRQVLLSYRASLDDSSRGLATTLNFGLDSFPLFVNPDTGQVEPYTIGNVATGSVDASITHYNFGVSLSLHDDLSVGATMTLAELDVTSNVLSQSRDPRGILNSINPRVDHDQDGLLDDVQTLSTINDDDAAYTWALGLHWHPDSMFESGISPVRIGAVYRKGAKLQVQQAFAEYDPDLGDFGAPEVFMNTFRVPDRYGVGISYEAGRSWVFALDGERVEYSDLLEDFQSGRNFFTSGRIPSGDLELDPDVPIRFDVDDATILRAGVEYNWITTGRVNYAIRGGYYNAPDNRIRMTQFNSTNPEINEVFLDLFRGGQDQDHYTVGFSVIAAMGFQIQAAGDFSDAGDQYVLSTIYRFGKVRR